MVNVARGRDWPGDTRSNVRFVFETAGSIEETGRSWRRERTVVLAETTTVGVLHSLANCFSRNVERVAILRRLALNMVRWTLYPGQGTPARRTSGQLVGEIRRSYLDKFGSMIRTVGSSWPSRIVHHFRNRPVDMVSTSCLGQRHRETPRCRVDADTRAYIYISMWFLSERIQESYLPKLQIQVRIAKMDYAQCTKRCIPRVTTRIPPLANYAECASDDLPPSFC